MAREFVRDGAQPPFWLATGKNFSGQPLTCFLLGRRSRPGRVTCEKRRSPFKVAQYVTKLPSSDRKG